MAKRRKPYHDGDMVVSFTDRKFERDLREAELTNFPKQSQLTASLDEALWILWVMREHFEHRAPMYADEVSQLLEVRGIALSPLKVERALARAGNRIIRKKLDDARNAKTAYMISEKGISHLEKAYAPTGINALIVDGTKPWSDRHLTLPEIAAELKGHIRVVDKFYGLGSLAILHYFKHGTPLQFLTGKTQESHPIFQRELRDFRREVPSLEVRLFPDHTELHDRYIITENTAIIVGHGIKDIGNKESFLILLKGGGTADLRKTLVEKFDDRWNRSTVVT
jgi:hypothetical protein